MPLNDELRETSADRTAGPNDAVLLRAVARAQAGDPAGIRFLYVRYADNLYGYVRSLVRDDFEAEDIVQHVFAKLMVIIGSYERREVPFSAWILRVARNAAVDHMRRSRTTPCEEVRGADEARDDGAHERVHGLTDALGALPFAQRNVLVLRHLVGLSPLEIAARMGRSESSVHGLHHRGRRALQRELRHLELVPATVAA